ncbi:MAG: UDP-N-acetylmuramoyl-tripeptide--D-alanyl-D-alanine ligase [Candidatus Omnitrophota bacterium]|nr:UDP-N-acetylmuramoyl-tripeptide--D-alanyl-D-alanine ligase [Candidatus Omnitrophota bacterium]
MNKMQNSSLTGFTLNEILEATGGKFIYGNLNVSVTGVSSDSRTIKSGELFIAIRGEKFDGHNFVAEAVKKNAQILIVDNNFRLDNIQKKLSFNADAGIAFVRVGDTLKALGDIASFHRRRFKIPVIAVTGSCGKTTTKDMIAEVLSARFNVLKNEGTFNNLIGLPQTLLKLNRDTEIVVVEMGTNKAGEIKRLAEIARPNAGVITNIGPAHLEFFGSLGAVLKEKFELIDNLQFPYLAILNRDDALLRKRIGKTKGKTIFTFGIKNKCDFQAADIKIGSSRVEFSLSARHNFRMDILGRHHVYNALAAIACGTIFGLSPEKLKKRLSNFTPPFTRINLKKIRDYQVIDDTYNSNPLSLECAIEVLKNFDIQGRKVLVMGDMLELGEKSIILHRKAGEKILSSGIDALITVGRFSTETAEFVRKSSSGVKVYSCGCALEARGILSSLLKADDLVLIKGSRAMQMEKAIQGL